MYHPVVVRSEPTPDPAAAGPGRPLRADAERNRARILRAAREVFAERGLDAALEDVARQAGVGIGTLYRRFPSREDLVEALFAARVDELVVLAEAATGEPDGWEALVGFVTRSLELQVEDRGLREVMLHSRWGQDRVSRLRDRVAPLVQRLVDRARGEGRLREDFSSTDVLFLVRMITAVADYAWPAAPDLWRRYLGLVLDGLPPARDRTSPVPPSPSLELTAEVMAQA